MKLRSSTEVFDEFNRLCRENRIGINGESVRKVIKDKQLGLRLCKLHIESSAALRREDREKDWLPWGVKSVKEFKALIK